MANFKKVFNFREGVQVDDQTFVVNGSLVGIGTSIPGKFFDVRRDASFSGLTTFTEVIVTTGATFETGAGKSVVISNFSFTGDSTSGGILTASSGIISYFGDGSQLANLPTSQWVDVDTGIGVSSVYNGGNVGIATLIPQYQLQVEANPLDGDGIGIRQGNIYASGFVTASGYDGNGALLSDLDADEITSGILTQARIPRLELDKLPLIPDFKLEQNQQLTGVVTALGGFIGSITGEVTGDIISSGFSTFNDGEFSGTLTAIASTAQSLTGTPDIFVGLVSATHADLGVAVTVARGIVTNDLNVGVLTVTNGDVKVGANGIEFNIIDGKVGIGTTQATTSEVVVQGANNARLEVVTQAGYSALNIGGDLGIGVSTVELKYENQELILSNYANGDFSYFLNQNQVDPNGIFRWKQGDSNETIMVLTSEGKLGIAVTDPTDELHVVGDTLLDGRLEVTGISTFQSNVQVRGGITYYNTSGISTAYDLFVANDLTVNSDAVFDGTVSLPETTIFNITSGLSTFNDLDVSGSLRLLNQTDFNLNTTTGISTFNSINILDTITLTGNLTSNIDVTEGISTFNDISVGGGITVSGMSTFISGLAVGAAITPYIAVGSTDSFPLSIGGTYGVEIPGDLNVEGFVTIASTMTLTEDLILDGGTIGFGSDQNFFTNAGVSTFNTFVVDDVLTVGTGMTIHGAINPIQVTDPDDEYFNTYGIVAISTFTDNVSIGKSIIIGTTDEPRCVVDVGFKTDSFVAICTVATDVRDGTQPDGIIIPPAIEGAIIYNVTLQKLQFYNGTAWETVTSS
jgi:hypothetical protein